VYRFALRSGLARRRRTGLSALAVLLGVAMVSGAYVFTDTIRAALRQMFSSQAQGAQVVVASPQGLFSATNPPASMPASLAARIAKLPGVATAQGQIADVATVVARDGHVIKSTGSPTLAISYLSSPLTGLQFVQGTAPKGPQEVALDSSTANRGHYHVGDLVPIVTGEPERRFQLSGIARFGGASIGGATFAVFQLSTAQSLYRKEGLVDAIYVSGNTGTPSQALEREIDPMLPSGLTARTTAQAVGTNAGQVAGQLRALTGGLEAFGFIAMFVGAFVIFNTLAITVAQRARELALLRALGASRGQVLGIVMAEAGALGVVCSLAGLVAGPAAALLIRAVIRGAGIEVPSTGLALEPRTAIVGLGVGIGVTLAAGLLPALRATRVTPVEGLGGSGPSVTRGRAWLPMVGPALVLAFVGAGVAFTSSGSSSDRMAAAIVGAALLLAAAVLVIPLVVPPLARGIAWPLERRGGIVARLARENATRAPARTAITASSLVVGLSMMLFLSIYAGGVRTATRRAIARSFVADFALGSRDGSSSIPAVSARAAAFVPNVVAASSLKTAHARIAGAGTVTAAGIDTTSIGQVYRFDWASGSGPDPARLGPEDILLERDTARAAHLTVGDRALITSPDGFRATLTVRGIYADRALLRGVALPLQAFDALFHQNRLQQVFVKLAPGANPAAAKAQLEQALAGLPGVVVRSERQLANEASGKVDAILVLFYALLLMSASMALLGMVNALALSIHERTRELGVLRAIGMTRAQARTLIRDESLITAALGTFVGVVLGIGLAWALSGTLSAAGVVFSVPWPQIGLLVAVGLAIGVLGALPPAARAAQVDLLTALAYE
jgi:putative ABC transport system permease protein